MLNKKLLKVLRILYVLLLIPAISIYFAWDMIYDIPTSSKMFTDVLVFSFATAPISLVCAIVLSDKYPQLILLPGSNIALLALVCLDTLAHSLSY